LTHDPDPIEVLALSHGQARWVLDYLGLHGGGDALSFDAYIKSLRRDGVPFARDELGVGPGHNLKYRYPHMMELAVALALRTQGVRRAMWSGCWLSIEPCCARTIAEPGSSESAG
jgi:hypothetical protein